MQIMNGDHAAFEIEHANTPKEQRPDWPLPSFDARDWAKAFCKTVKEKQGVELDEGWMVSWFASALMRGHDEANGRCYREVREFIGWLSGDIPELRAVEVPKLADSWERFRARPAVSEE
jgi:hypothetical protein